MTSFHDDQVNRLMAAVRADKYEVDLHEDHAVLHFLVGKEIKTVSLTYKQLRDEPTSHLIEAIQNSPVVDHLD